MKHLPNIPAPRLTPWAAAVIALAVAVLTGGILTVLT